MMSFVRYFENIIKTDSEKDMEVDNIPEKVKEATSAIAPVIIPFREFIQKVQNNESKDDIDYAKMECVGNCFT